MVSRTFTCEDCERLLGVIPQAMTEKLLEIADTVRMDPSPAGRIQRAMERLGRALSVDRVSLIVPYGEAALRVVASSDPVETGDLILSLERYPELDAVLRTGEALVVPDVADSDLLSSHVGALRRAGVVSVAAVVFSDEQAGGVLRATSRSRHLDTNDLAILAAAGHLLEHALSEPTVSESEETGWLELLLRVSDGVLVTGPDGVVRRVVGTWHRLGLEPSSFIGRSLEQLTEPGFEAAARDHALLALQGGRRTAPTRLRLRSETGEGVAVDTWAVRRTGGRGILVALRKPERSAAPGPCAVVAAIPEPAALIDPDGAVRCVNEALASRLGEEAASLRGRSGARLLERLGGNGGDTRTRTALADGSALVIVRDSRRRAGPTPLEERLRRTIARNLDELETMNRRLESMDVERARFLAWSAHELKTPLTVIQSHLEIVLEDLSEGLSGEQVEFLRIAHESALHMRRMVLDLTDLAALQSGQMPLDITRVPLDEVTGAVLREMEPLARSAGVTLETDCPPIPLRADSGRVEQVLRNLLDNAIRFTPEGGRVTLSATVEEEAGQVVITVADTGIGIPPGELETIFEPFVQAERPPAGRQRGSGLGLFICRRIALALGGRIEAGLRPGGGAVFTFRVPLWPEGDATP